jgi:hypothetical protein
MMNLRLLALYHIKEKVAQEGTKKQVAPLFNKRKIPLARDLS